LLRLYLINHIERMRQTLATIAGQAKISSQGIHPQPTASIVLNDSATNAIADAHYHGPSLNENDS
jgi:hypothetical protein